MLVEQRVYFAIKSDDLNPDQISEAIGLLPDRDMWRASRDAANDIPRTNGWYLDSSNPRYEPGQKGIGCYLLHAETADLIERLTPSVERIRKLVDDGLAFTTLECVRTFTKGELAHSSIGTSLERSDIAFLASVGAVLDIDEYDETYDDDDEPDIPPIIDENGNKIWRLL